MADMSKQRLIGALLLLSVIVIAAVLLVKNANDNMEETAEITLPEFQASVDTTDHEAIDAEQEALIDPHGLGEDVIAKADDAIMAETTAVTKKEADKLAAAIPDVVPKTEVKQAVAAPTVTKPQPIKKSDPAPPVKVVEKVTGPQWLIQLASFGVKSNAVALQKKVAILGYQANIQAFENSQEKTVYRLRIGPEADRQKVDLIVSKMQQHLKIKPQVIKLP